MSPLAMKSEKAIFSTDIKVKVTRSLYMYLVSFYSLLKACGAISLVEYACKILSLYYKSVRADYRRIEK